MYIYDYEIPGEESGIRHGVMFRGQRAVTLVRPDDLDLSTLVEVCYVDGEEMVVGAEYIVSDDLIKEDSYCHTCRFAGILRQRAMFYKGIRGDDKPLYECFSHWRLIEPVPTYHLVKSIDGKEVSRVEVSEEKAKELEE
jgi:hypothetical protein